MDSLLSTKWLAVIECRALEAVQRFHHEVQDELCNVLGETVGVKFEVEEADPNVVEAAPAAPRAVRREAARATPIPPAADPVVPSVRITPELREQLRNSEPLIKTLMDDLGAEIVKVE